MNFRVVSDFTPTAELEIRLDKRIYNVSQSLVTKGGTGEYTMTTTFGYHDFLPSFNPSVCGAKDGI